MNRVVFLRALPLAVMLTAVAAAQSSSDLPTTPEGLNVSLVAREPLVRNPCALAFDARGRMFVGQGPQYRSPKPDTPPDRISILIDTDGDGVADKAQTFAEGFNVIQSLAWRGRDLWVANSPDLTLVRDLDGDDVADEYIKVYTDLGNVEHAIHGLNWAPDGKLYFSKGNSKGMTLPGRVAPKPFRELWDVKAPAGTPDFPPPQVFTRDTYRSTYQDPDDDWGRQGGILRCDPMGENLEIVSRGMRNPFSLGFDSGFNWLCTDNDQNNGDRILMPFPGAHFGWGHQWSTHWTGEDHLPTVPMSGPVFPGSGTGVVYYDWPQLPAAFREVWFLNDWLRQTTFVYRPEWAGALVQPAGGAWKEFTQGGGALYNPVDLKVGPDGALYTTGWGVSYGVVWDGAGNQINEGRVFRFGWEGAPATTWHAPKRTRALSTWSTTELIEDLDGQLPVWQGDAQVELVRRGESVRGALVAALEAKNLTRLRQTWLLWTLAQLSPKSTADDEYFASLAKSGDFNGRLQSLRILAHRIREYRPGQSLAPVVAATLSDPEPRLRFAAAQAVFQSRDPSLHDALTASAAQESDRITYYAIWQAMRETFRVEELKALLTDARGGVRRAALLALLDVGALSPSEVQPLVSDKDPETANLAALWQAKRAGNPLIVMEPAPGDFSGDELKVKLTPGVKPGVLRYTDDGSAPTINSKKEGGLVFKDTTSLNIALFVDGKQVGSAVTAVWRKREPLAPEAVATLEPPSGPTTPEAVLALLPTADPAHGQAVFNAAGCYVCHQAGGEGGLYGPDLTNFGDRGKVESLVRSILYPNEVIAEGFALQNVTLKDGQGFSGVLREETDRVLELMQADSQPVRIDKAKIAKRESLHQSPMPSFEHVLGPKQMAELAAWLLSQRSLGSAAAESGAAAPEKVVSGVDSVNSDLTWVMEANRIVFSDQGREVTEFVFKDDRVLRPHFRNLYAPGGKLVSRHYPPMPPDLLDHGDLHPGLWMAFGNINGEDFWRNKARIEHVRFTVLPHRVGSRVEFAAETRFLSKSGMELATQLTTYTLERVGYGYLIAMDTSIRAGAKPLVFGAQEEMGFGIRLTHLLIEKHGGMVMNSAGQFGAKAVWGEVADWCDYSREVDGARLGVTIFPGEENERPSWWHTRDYGLMVANPFGARVDNEGSAPLRVESGQELRLRFGAWIYQIPAGANADRSRVSQIFRNSFR